MKYFRGIYTALVTPFKDGEIDKKSLVRLVRYQMDRDIDGLVVNGTTAESPTLLPDEVASIFEIVKAEVSGQVPLIFGSGTHSTESTIRLSRLGEKWGADGLLVVTPYYNKPPQRGLIQHFLKVAQAVSCPILLYNIPGRSVVSIDIETLVVLSQAKNIVGVKDATGDLDYAKQVIKKTPPSFTVTSGDDNTLIPHVLAGGDGAISVASNLVPDRVKHWFDLADKNDKQGAEKSFMTDRKLIEYLGVETNPIPIKAALYEMGVIASDEMRLPLCPLSDEHRSRLKIWIQDNSISGFL